MNKEFDDILKVGEAPPSQREIFGKRLNRIKEAISWKVGTFKNKTYTTLWEGGEYRVALGKPGKESQDSYQGDKNVHDMRPEIFRNGKNLNVAATFGDVISDLEEVAKIEKYCVELFGVLLFRSAFLLDHKEQKTPAGDLIYRYQPNKKVLDYITNKITSIYKDVPPEVFLQYLDAIALNEDVKYYCKGKDLERTNIGAKNNYLTYVMLIAVITGDLPISSIARKLLRTNVSAISNRDALRVLPHLKG